MLFRKLLTDCILFFTIVLFSLSIIIWVFQAVNYLDIIIEDGRDYLIYLYFTLLNLPKIISKIFPFAIFFSFIYVISNYELRNELVIYWNIGVNKLSLYNFLFLSSVLITVIQITLTSIIVPKSQDYARTILRNSNVNFFDNFVKTKKFNDLIKGLTIYIEDKDEKNNLKNIFLKKQNQNNGFQITFAKKGYFQDNLNSQTLVLINGQTISFINNNITIFNFSKTNYSLTNLESNTILVTKIQENSTYELIKCIIFLIQKKKNNLLKENFKISNCSVSNLNNIYSELYKRLIIPLYIPVLIAISLGLILSSKESSNYNRLRTVIFLMGFCLIIFSEITLRFINRSLIHNITISLIPIVLIVLNYLFIFFKFRNNKIKK